MNLKRYATDMLQLGRSERDIKHSCKLIGRLAGSYSWIDSEEFVVLSLECAQRANETYRTGRTASTTTWFMGILRNAAWSYIRRELKARDHGTLSEELVPEARASSVEEQVALDDELDILFRMLSPAAWRLLWLTLQVAPKRVTDRAATELLGCSSSGVHHLREEVAVAVHSAIPASIPLAGKR